MALRRRHLLKVFAVFSPVYWGASAPIGSNTDTPSGLTLNGTQRLWIAATLARGVLR
jgi:hypothetical protein